MNLTLRTTLPFLALAIVIFGGAAAVSPERAQAQCTTTLGEPVLVCTDRPIPGVTSGTNGCLSGSGYVEQSTETSCEGGAGGGGGGGELISSSADLSANPLSISRGSSSTLRATSENVASCSIDNGVGTVTPNAPHEVTVSPSQTTTYTLTCDDYNGNTLTDTARVTVAASPDLIGQVGGAATATMSQAITLYGGVANQGAADAGYFPNIIQVCDENCANINSILSATPAESLAVGGWQQVATSYTPNSMSQQYYRVCANKNTSMVDVHTESNYANNCSGWQYLTVGTPMPDLTAGGVTPTTATQGQTRTLSATISNIGTRAAGASTGYFRLTAPVAKNSTTALVSTPTVPVGGSTVASFNYTFASAGTYSVQLCADWNGAVAESNEGNNCGPWTDIVVNETPVGSSVSCTVSPSSAVVGGSVTYTAHPVAAATSPYSWTGSDGATGFGSNSTAVRTFTAPGSYGMQVSATNAASSAQCPVVSVGAGWCTTSTPDLTITASPARVRSGQSTTLTWSASGVNGQNATCAVTGPGVSWSSAVSAAPVCSASGSANPTIQTQSVYTLTCAGVSESVTVNVIPNFQEF